VEQLPLAPCQDATAHILLGLAYAIRQTLKT